MEFYNWKCHKENATVMTTIKINYTAFLINDWECIFEKHLFMILKTGLYSKCNTFNVFAYPKIEKIQKIIDKYGMSEKMHVKFQIENRYEFPAIIDLIDDPYEANLYLHTKGVSLKDNPKSYVPSLAWNDYMTYFNIIHHDVCLDFLKENDTVGVEFGASLSEPDKFHYSGNFWWASKQHLENIGKSNAYKDFLNCQNRYDCETIVGSVSGRYVELFNSGTNTPKTGALYFSPIIRYSLSKENVKIWKI